MRAEENVLQFGGDDCIDEMECSECIERKAKEIITVDIAKATGYGHTIVKTVTGTRFDVNEYVWNMKKISLSTWHTEITEDIAKQYPNPQDRWNADEFETIDLGGY